MANTVISLLSSGEIGNTPVVGNLANGELALNFADGIIYYKKSDQVSLGQIKTTQPSGLNQEIQFNDSGSFGANANLSFNKSTKTLTVDKLLVSNIAFTDGTFSTTLGAPGNNKQVEFNNNGTTDGDDGFLYDYANSTVLTTNIRSEVLVTNTYIQFADGSKQYVANAGTGGAGTPGGLDTQVQFNDGGSFGGNSSFTFNKSTGYLKAPIIESTNNGQGTNFKVGDDVWLGDINLADTLSIRGQQNVNNAYISFGASNANTLGRAGTGPLTYTGNFVATGELSTLQSSGDEGGQINFGIPQTNTTLSSGVVIDVYQNRLRFWESGGTNRGAYIDLTVAATSVGTNLLSGGGGTTDQYARDHANGAFDLANGTAGVANTDYTTISATAGLYGNNIIVPQLSVAANGRISSISNVSIRVASTTEAGIVSLNDTNTSTSTTEAATAAAVNSVYTYAQTKYDKTGGTISGDVTVTGNLVVEGNTLSVNVSTLIVDDPLIQLAKNNTTDSVDIGFIGHYDTGSGAVHAGLIRRASDDTFYLFDNLTTEPVTNIVDIANSSIATLKANLTSDVITLRGFDPLDRANNAYNHANGAFNLANGTAGVANTDYTTISAVAGVYGNSSTVPAVTLAANGRVSLISNTAIDMSAITTGTLAVARGGTGVTTSTGTGAVVLGTDPTISLPVINNIKKGYSTIVTAAGTTTLTVNSNHYQRFTGTTTQNIFLPVTSTLTTGMSFSIENASTGNLSIYSSGGFLVATVIPGATISCLCIGTTLTSALDWDPEYIEFASITGTGSVVLNTSPSITSLGVGTTASGVTGEIRATNNITAFFSSDIRYKTNVEDIKDALYKVISIGGKTFSWTEDYIQDHGGEDGYFIRQDDFGVIAQDVQKVFPQAVRERQDGFLAVDYVKLSALAFQAIIELKKEVEEIKKLIK